MRSEATFTRLIESIQTAHRELAAQAGKAINISLTLRNWLIGHYIAEYELNGKDRALYGDRLFNELARALKAVSNCNRRQLYRYRRFYDFYQRIVGALPPQFKTLPLLPTPEKVGTPSPQSATPAANLITRLSYSHFDALVDIDDVTKRAFYEVECMRGNWSVRELKRQISSLYYERSGLSLDKKKLAELTQQDAEPQPVEYVLAGRDNQLFVSKSQMESGELLVGKKSQTASGELAVDGKCQMPSGEVWG